jgi:hypothetical protein
MTNGSSVFLPISNEMLDDIPRPLTIAEIAAAEARHQDLKARGLLADDGREIKVTDCPAVYYAGHEGDETFACELPRGHAGNHAYGVEW